MSSESSDAVSKVQETQATPDLGARGKESQKPLMASVGLAILGGIVVWAILQASFPRMKLPREFEEHHDTPPDVREAAKIYQKKMAIVNSTFAMGVFGVVLGGMAALAWLGKQRSKLLGLLAALAAALISGGFGWLAGYAGAAIFEKARASGTDLELTSNLMMHTAMLSIVGGGVGLAVGALMIRTWKAVAGALVAGSAAGFLAGAAYVTLAALLILSARTHLIIPGDPQQIFHPERILWIGLTALLTGWIIAAFTPIQKSAAL
jgi:hypothetical protein